MLASQIQKQILAKGAHLIRPRKAPRVKGQPIHYDVKPLFTGNKRGWVLLDITTAHAMQTCYNALSINNRIKWDCIPIMKLVDFTWNSVS